MTAGHESEERLRELRKRLGDGLRAARQAKGMSLRKFAQVLVRSHGNLSEWETGVRLPPRDVVEAYEREFGAEPGSLVALWADAQPAAEERPRRPLRHRTVERPTGPSPEEANDGQPTAAATDANSGHVDERPEPEAMADRWPATSAEVPAPAPLSARGTVAEPVGEAGSPEARIGASSAKEETDASAQRAAAVVSSWGHRASLGTQAEGTDAGAPIPISTEGHEGAVSTPTGTPPPRPSRGMVGALLGRHKVGRGLRGKPIRTIGLVLGLVVVAALIATTGGTPQPHDPPRVAADFEAMAVDGRTGVLYVADFGGDRIYRLTPSGQVAPFAGSGGRGFGGDGGPATAAILHGPSGLAVDRNGNVFIADQLNGRVRRVAPDGIITTVAITEADRKPTTETGLELPTRVAVDNDANLYVAHANGRLIQKVGSDGRMVTVAGGGPKPLGDATLARETTLPGVAGLAVDGPGDVYFTTEHRLFKVGPGGRTVVVAGTGVSGFSGDGGAANKAQLASPSGIAVDRRGQIFVADKGNGRVRQIVDGTIHTIAGGGGEPPDHKVGAKATASSLKAPRGVTVDDRGNLLIDDAAQGGLRKRWPSGRMTTLAITPIASSTTTTATTTTTTIAPTPTTAPLYGPIFNEPFTRQMGWRVSDTGDSQSVYADGGYRMTVTRGTSGLAVVAPLQSILSPTGPVPNDALTIESKVTFESTSFQAGLVCRAKSGEGGGYRAQLTGGGIWTIFRFEPGAAAGDQGTRLAGGGSNRAPEMRTDGPNQLRLDCLGGASGGPVTVAFSVNGHQLASVEDPEGLSPGQVWLVAQISTNASTQTASALFDDFVVSRQRWPAP